MLVLFCGQITVKIVCLMLYRKKLDEILFSFFNVLFENWLGDSVGRRLKKSFFQMNLKK